MDNPETENLVLRMMRDDEFSTYVEYFTQDYANELTTNHRYTFDASLQLAKAEIKEELPDGPQTQGQFLLCAESQTSNSVQVIGYLWYEKNKKTTTAFINDFYVFSQYRSQGFGTRVIQLLELSLLSEGIKRISLRVAQDNPRAFKLYKELGFFPTGINMAKIIASHR